MATSAAACSRSRPDTRESRGATPLSGPYRPAPRRGRGRRRLAPHNQMRLLYLRWRRRLALLQQPSAPAAATGSTPSRSGSKRLPAAGGAGRVVPEGGGAAAASGCCTAQDSASQGAVCGAGGKGRGSRAVSRRPPARRGAALRSALAEASEGSPTAVKPTRNVVAVRSPVVRVRAGRAIVCAFPLFVNEVCSLAGKRAIVPGSTRATTKCALSDQVMTWTRIYQIA